VKVLIALLAAASLSGCANMTPEQRAQFGRDLAVGLAIGAAAGAAARPAYQPVYQMPTVVYHAPPTLNCTSQRLGQFVNTRCY
jgi:hypothetical protein